MDPSGLEMTQFVSIKKKKQALYKYLGCNHRYINYKTRTILNVIKLKFRNLKFGSLRVNFAPESIKKVDILLLIKS